MPAGGSQSIAKPDPATREINEATLLSAMESAGKLVEDEELREAMSAKGLGTPATRASIIEGLISENYLQRAPGVACPPRRHFH